MRKLISVLLALAVALCATAFAEPVPEPEPGSALELEAEKTDPAVLEERLTVMLPVVDALARTLSDDVEAVYAPEDDAFVWAQLLRLAAPDAAEAERAEVPAETLRLYAAASFAGMEALPPLPESEAGDEAEPAVVYDEETDTYTVAAQTPRQLYVVVEGYSELEAGLQIAVGLYERTYDFRLDGFTGSLTDNPLYVPEETEDEADLAEGEVAEGEATEEVSAASEAAESADAETGEEESEEGAAEAPNFPYAVADFRRESEDDFAGLERVSCYLRLPEKQPELIEEVLLPFSALSWGSSGSEVAAMQRRLNELGYSCGGENGTFGAGTLRAVRYFQDALELPQNGIATVELQNRLFSQDAPAFNPYANLFRGKEGVRVEEMQARLRELGYMSRPVDGVFEDRTRQAVVLFQETMGLDADGIAGRMTLTALEASDAPVCPGFIDLQRGDTGARVTEMQEQLIRLGFMTGWASGTYDAATAAAASAYMQANAIEEDGEAGTSALTIARMFGLVPTPEPTPSSSPTPDTAPAAGQATEETPTPQEPAQANSLPAAPTEEPENVPVELETPAPEPVQETEESDAAENGTVEIEQPEEP